MKKKNAIIIKKDKIPEENNVESFISQAIKSNVSVETLERLLAMRKELKAEKAKEAFISAMAELQKELPEIKTTKVVKTKSGAEAYKYAPLNSIISQVKGVISKYGFSYFIKTETKEKTVKATCIVRHSMGHEEESTMEVPLGSKTMVMSDSQVTAAALTFAKRYAFNNAFGIMTGDDDNEENLRPAESNTEILAKIEKCNTVEELKKTYAALTKEQKADEEILAKFKDVKTLINDEIPVV